MNNPKQLSPELKLVLESYLIRHAQEWQKYQREYPEIAHSSVHIAPDMSYVAIEHEEISAVFRGQGTERQIIRRSPACIEVLCKL